VNPATLTVSGPRCGYGVLHRTAAVPPGGG